jgi:hypothetical protein
MPLEPVALESQISDVLDLSKISRGWHRSIEYVLPITNPIAPVIGPRKVRCLVYEEVVSCQMDQ